MDGQETSLRDDPAADAAGLLIRIGFGILVLIAPFAALFHRQSFVVLAPVGMLLITISAFVDDTGRYLAELRRAFLSPLGLVILGFCLWTVLSLLWTPFPAGAAERAFRTFGNMAITTAAYVALPSRMRLSNLNLLSLGIAIAVVLLIAGAIFGPSFLQFISHPRGPTLSRAAIAAGVLVWAALAWSITRGRDIEGIALIAAGGVAAMTSGSIAAAVVLFTGLLVFLAARVKPLASANALAAFWAGIILLAPLFALVARFLSEASQLGTSSILSQIGTWANVIGQQPARLLTGHGFDTLQRARTAGLVDPLAPGGLLPELWFDLGLPGALGLAVAVFLALRAMAHAPAHVTAAALAVVSSILVFMIIDPTSTQPWWLSVCVVAVVTMAAVQRGQYRTRRPRAAIGDRRGIAAGQTFGG